MAVGQERLHSSLHSRGVVAGGAGDPGRRASRLRLACSAVPVSSQPCADRSAIAVEGRRRRVRGAGDLLALRGEESQRGTGELELTQRGVLDIDEQSLAAGLLPGVHLVDGPDLSGGDPDLVQSDQQIEGLPAGELPLDDLDQSVAAGDALLVRLEARGDRVEVESRTELTP